MLRFTEDQFREHQERIGSKPTPGRKPSRKQPVTSAPRVAAKGNQNIGPAGMNKTEARYEQEILVPKYRAGEIVHWSFESTKKRITWQGGRCWYTPDFEVMCASGLIEFHEIKGGHIQEDALIKFKAAAELYPMYGWLLWQLSNGGEWKLLADSRRLNRSNPFCGSPSRQSPTLTHQATGTG